MRGVLCGYGFEVLDSYQVLCEFVDFVGRALLFIGNIFSTFASIQLVNDPQSPTAPQKFSLCCNDQSTIPSEMQQIKQIMTHTNPASFHQNPLAYHIRNIAAFVSREAPRLHAQQKHITLVVCTQGLLTDQSGHISQQITHDFQEALVSLFSLPVKIVFRLATDDERVVEFYNSLDSKSAVIDVLDDYWGEALEVYMHNPWLTYGLGLHRLREAGCAWGILDVMDERPLNMDQLFVFCTLFLLGGGPVTAQLPHPRMNWDAFLHGLNVLLQKEKLQWNPVLGKQTPWIDLNKLNAIFGGHRMQQHAHPQYAPQYQHATQYQHVPQPQHATHQNYGQQSAPQTAGSYTNHQHHAPKAPPQPSTHPGSAFAAKSQTHTPSTPQQPAHNEHANKPIKDQIMLTWALIPPQYQKLHPLPRLLVTVPNNFTRVEPHSYFDKWKPFSNEAFQAGGSEQKALLKRGQCRFD